MRKLLLLILSGAMLIGGLYLVIIELLFARVIYFRFVIGGFVIGGTVLVVMGAYLVWADFVAPRLGIKTWEDSQG
jgi:hypothetical protein